MRNYHIAIHYRDYEAEVYDQQFPNLPAVFEFVLLAITFPLNLLYVVVLPC